VTSKGKPTARESSFEVHLLGQVDFSACLDLQQRLVYESGGRADGQVDLLLCEHPPTLTVGRRGSRAHLIVSRRELESRQIPLHWVNRGGGCLVHVPGQLAVYPIVPLAWHGYSVGQFLERLQSGIQATLEEMKFTVGSRPGRYGLWTRTGQVVAVAAAVKNWTSYFGAYINVAPDVDKLRLVNADPLTGTRMTTLSAERRQPVKMTRVREGLIRHLSAAFACPRYHIHSGHPLLHKRNNTVQEAARAG
jgi:lipoyl(octanoyl) transferase